MASGDQDIGRREYGQRGIKRETSYHCAIMDEVVYESETVIETNTSSPFFGMRVCTKHRDDVSYEQHAIENPPRVGTDEDF